MVTGEMSKWQRFLRVWLLCVGVCALMRAPTPNAVAAAPSSKRTPPSSAKTANKGPFKRDPRTDRLRPQDVSRHQWQVELVAEGYRDRGERKGFERRSVLVTDLEADTTSGHRPALSLALLAPARRGFNIGGRFRYMGTVGYAERGPDGADDSTRFLLGRQVELLGVLRRVFWFPNTQNHHVGGIRSGHGLNRIYGAVSLETGVSLLMPRDGLRKEIDAHRREGISVWAGPRLGWHVGPTLGVGYRIWDRLFLRAFGGMSFVQLYVFQDADNVDGVAFEKRQRLDIVRTHFGLAIETRL